MEKKPTNPPDAPRRAFLPFAIGLPLAFAVVILILMVFQYRQVKALVAKSPAPMEVIPQSLPAEKAVLEKVKIFLDTASPLTGDTLRLAATEVNHLMRTSPVLHDQGETYRLELQDSLMVLTNVMPAKKLNGPVAWMVKLFDSGGWLNSRMEGRLTLEKGRLKVLLTRAYMNGIEAPVSTFNRDNRLDPRKMTLDTAAFDAYIARLTEVDIERDELILIRD